MHASTVYEYTSSSFPCLALFNSRSIPVPSDINGSNSENPEN